MDKLFKLTGFLPFVVIVFLNAFIDLGHKILIQNTVFKIYDDDTRIILTAIIDSLILLPFLLLLSPAGFLSDRYRKPRIMKISAAATVALTLLITLAYYSGWFRFAFALTFLLAVQSAFYSPAKYGYLRELTGNARLAVANGVVQAVSAIAILSAIFVFSLFFEYRLTAIDYRNEGEILRVIAPTGWVLVACALAEFLLALQLCPTRSPNRDLHFDRNHYAGGRYLRDNLKRIFSNQVIWLSVVGLSIFWGISQVVLVAFPAFAKDSLSQTDTVVIQGVMSCSGIGIFIGSLAAGRASRHHIETGLVPLGALGIVLALFLIPQAGSIGWLVPIFLLLGISGGMFIVPLNALIQFHADDGQLGRILAANHSVQSLTMLGLLILSVLFVLSGLDSTGLLYLVAFAALGGTLYTVRKLPQSLVRLIISRLFSSTHRIQVLGLDNLPGQGGILLLGNHISWLDWAIVQIACPRTIHFVMHRGFYELWYLKWFLDLFGVIPIARGQSREALAAVGRLLTSGEVVCIFPEGAISRNGQLGEFKTGYLRAAASADGVIVPFYLRGLWGSRFSRSNERLRESRSTGSRRDVIVAFGTPIPLSTQPSELKQRIFDLSIDAWDRHTRSLDPVPLAWIRSCKRRGLKFCMADAVGGRPLSGHRALASVFALSRSVDRQSPEQNIGLLLPTGCVGMIVNMALLLRGRTVVNLDYTCSPQKLRISLSKARVHTVYTSGQFLGQLSKRGIELDQLRDCVKFVDIEESRHEHGSLGKLVLLAAIVMLPSALLFRLFGKYIDIEQPAAIIYTAGSEGEPKGVVLSHRNFMGNIRQISDVLDTREQDLVAAVLPLFHAYGLTVTGLMPLIEGIPVVFHANSSDTTAIARTVARYQATILCGTSTLLYQFTRNTRVHPLMLESLRLVVCGAAPLLPEVRNGFKLRFNKEIYEGYGTTETTPVASVNIPDRIDPRDWRIQQGNKPGTVGMPLPGSSYRIVDPDTLEPLPVGKDGMILFGGAQVMLGYLEDPEKTAAATVQQDGIRWFKTGDKGHLDEDGFLTIVGRSSRFAQIGGDTISLAGMEESIRQQLSPSAELVAVSIPGPGAGTDDRIVLLFAGDVTLEGITKAIEWSGLGPGSRPAELIPVESIPKLGSGDIDFGQASRIAMKGGAV